MLWRGALHFGHELLLLHPPVLEPDGDLPLRQVGRGGDLPPLVLGDEFVGCVLFLQFFQLNLGVRYSLLSAPAERRAVVLVRHDICGQREGSLRTWLHMPGHTSTAFLARSFTDISVPCCFSGINGDHREAMLGVHWPSIPPLRLKTWWTCDVCT